MSITLGQVALTVADVDRSEAFYRDALGLPLLFAAGSMRFFDLGATRLMLSAPEGELQPGSGGSVLYLKTADLQAAWERTLQGGAVAVSPPHRVAPMPTHDLWMAFFRDPDGHLLAWMAEVPRG